jgi:hypothetical protein
VGSFGDALAAARTRGKLGAESRVIYMAQEGGRLQRLMEFFDVSTELRDWPAAASLLGLPSAVLPGALRDAQAELSWLADLGLRGAGFSAVVHCLCAPAQ